jgi:hypothetical protein
MTALARLGASETRGLAGSRPYAETDRRAEACAALGVEHLHIDLSQTYRTVVAALADLDRELSTSEEELTRTRRAATSGPGCA